MTSKTSQRRRLRAAVEEHFRPERERDLRAIERMPEPERSVARREYSRWDLPTIRRAIGVARGRRPMPRSSGGPHPRVPTPQYLALIQSFKRASARRRASHKRTR